MGIFVTILLFVKTSWETCHSLITKKEKKSWVLFSNLKDVLAHYQEREGNLKYTSWVGPCGISCLFEWPNVHFQTLHSNLFIQLCKFYFELVTIRQMNQNQSQLFIFSCGLSLNVSYATKKSTFFNSSKKEIASWKGGYSFPQVYF